MADKPRDRDPTTQPDGPAMSREVGANTEAPDKTSWDGMNEITGSDMHDPNYIEGKVPMKKGPLTNPNADNETPKPPW